VEAAPADEEERVDAERLDPALELRLRLEQALDPVEHLPDPRVEARGQLEASGAVAQPLGAWKARGAEDAMSRPRPRPDRVPELWFAVEHRVADRAEELDVVGVGA